MIYLPYSDFARSSLALDPTTLGSQVLEILDLLDNLHDVAIKPYINLSLVAAWKGHEPQLCQYNLLCVEALQGQGHTGLSEFERTRWHLECATSGDYTLDKPAWVGDQAIHTSHQSLLLQIDPAFYSKRFRVSPTLPLIWS